MEIGTWIDFGILIVAIVAAAFSFREIQSNNVAERNKLLSQLNRRYLNSNDIQVVVKYLRQNAPSDVKPSPYQIDMFLRFFEELGVYLKKKTLAPSDVKNFFHYYLERFYSSDRGTQLRNDINNEELDWPYLNDYKSILPIDIKL